MPADKLLSILHLQMVAKVVHEETQPGKIM
jgi:hypothetical protein